MPSPQKANREWEAYRVTVDVDLLIIGAGPTGLFAAYYAGFRGFRTAILDSLPEPGGQITAMYPEKLIFDVAGFPSVKGQTLVDDLVAQAGQFDPTYLLEERAEELERLDDGSLRIRTYKELEVRAKAVLITGGIGTFSPRSLPGADLFEHKGLRYFVPKLDELAHGATSSVRCLHSAPSSVRCAPRAPSSLGTTQRLRRRVASVQTPRRSAAFTARPARSGSC